MKIPNMKKVAILLALISITNVKSQNYLPLATTGYTLDAVAESTTAVSTTGGSIDGSDYILYSAAYGAMVSSTYGLPNNGIIAAGTKTFQLQNYTGPNLLYIPANLQDSLTLVNPVACFSLSLLGFATEGAASMSVTVRFTDNTTQVFTGIAVNDWFNTAPTAFYSGFDRATRTTGTVANVGSASNPRMFNHDLSILCANQSKKVKRIIIKNTTSARVCIMAASAILSPLAVSASPVNICNAGPVTITASGASTYTWVPVGSFTGSSTAVISVTPASTTNYTVQTTSTQSCILNATVAVNVFTAAPSLTIVNTANSGSICPNSTVALTASGATSYSWTGGATTITNASVFSPTVSSTYIVSGVNACGTTTAAATVSVHPFPTVNPVASSSTLCAGNGLTLTATGNATNYVWSGGTAPSGNGVGFVPALTATYTVIGTSAISCTASATIPVTVYATPINAPLANPAIVCIGGSSTLSASGALSYTWSSATQTVNTIDFVITPTLGTTTYTVIKSNSTCSDTKTISVTTNPLPIIFAIVTPTVVCALTPATLAVGGAQTYTWTSPGPPTYTFGGASPVVSPVASSIYSVAASDGTCINTTTVYLAANPNPTITASASTPSTCGGEVVTLTATGGINYTWTSTGSATSSAQSFTDAPTIPTAYNVTGDNSFGCISGAGQVVLVLPSPTIVTSSGSPLVCSGGSVIVTANGAGTYTWSTNAGGVNTNTALINPVNMTSGPVTFTVEGTSATNLCKSKKTVLVNVFVPTLSVAGNTNTCAGGSVTLSIQGGNSNYNWNTGSANFVTQNITASLTAPAVFTLSANTSSAGISCASTKTIALGIYSNPIITAVAQRTTICIKEAVSITAAGGETYLWNTGSTNTILTVSPVGNIVNYTVTGTDVNGCSSTASVQIKISGCSGIPELNAGSGLSIYPNPSNGVFTIETNSAIQLNLVNELGQLVRVISLSDANNYQVSVNDLEQGIYFIFGQKENVQIYQKIVVTK
jgi:hypothetical protein